MAKSTFSSDESGFSLAEVLVATLIMVTGLVTLAGMFAVSTQTNRMARVGTMTMVLAQQKMEQLRGLAWGFDLLALPLSDTTTDISQVPFTSGGAGLSPSPAGTLTHNVPGYVDFLDGAGNWVGTGDTRPDSGVYTRRWSIEPLPANPNNTLILQVLVTRHVVRGGTADNGAVARLPEEARLVSVKTRKSL